MAGQWDASASDVVLYAIAMALVATLLWISYRTMQHPRLPVIHRPDKPPLVTVAGALRYLITTPLLVGFWMAVLITLLSAAAKDRSGVQVVVATCAVIGGARLLAHVKQDIAHELAKAVPITILSFIIIGGGLAGIDPFIRSFEQVPPDLVDSYWLGLIVWDVFLTAMWLLGVHVSWRRQHQRQMAGEPVEAPVVRLLRRLRSIGYRDPSA